MTTYTVEINEVNTDKLWLVANMAMDPILGALRIAPGVDGGYFGLQIQDKHKLYLVQVRKPGDQSLVLSDPKVKDTVDVISNTHISRHASFDVNPSQAFSGAVTGIARVAAKEGVSREDVQSALTSLTDAVRALPDVTGAVFGYVAEDDSFVVSAGWKSLNHYYEGTHTKDVHNAIVSLKEIASLDLKHTVLSCYKGY